MKQPHDVVDDLFRVCPSFQAAAQTRQADWLDAEGHIALDPFLTAFANHLAEMYECEETDEFPKIFQVINRLYEEGDQQVRQSFAMAFVGSLDLTHPGYTTNTDRLLDYLNEDLLRDWETNASSSKQMREVVSTLFHIYPEFEATHERYYQEYLCQEADIPLYTIFDDFAVYLISLLECGETEQFPAFFTEVERFLHVGIRYVGNAIVLGLLRDLQNVKFYKTGKPEQFRPYLGPESVQSWDYLMELWD